MDHSICPLCYTTVPSQEIERHVNDHLADEEFSRDLELAQEIELAPPTPPHPSLEVVSESSSSKGAANTDAFGGGGDIDVKIASLIKLQFKEIFYQVEGGMMACLKNCLASEFEKDTTSILCGYVDHFQSQEFEDVGWGCGWRNIQMLSSHLIKERQETRDLLFGGAAFVPDIASLQRWLEIAWELGFDTQGSNEFDSKIYGRKNWIGTTECAALFRSFGLRAMIVDFCGKEIELAGSTIALDQGKMLLKQNTSKRKVAQVYGPMDRFLSRDPCKGQHLSSHVGKAEGPEFIIDWVWNYFSNSNSTKLGSQHVVLSDKAPLYFQEEGHSRTIVGIQATLKSNGIHHYNLLILDPAHPTEALEKSLMQNFGWQQLIKRGIHTLKKHQYQLCFIEPGIASGEEREQLKILRGIHCEI